MENTIFCYNSATVCPISAKFCTKMQNPTITVECQKFRIFRVQDGRRICAETLQSQMLQSIARGGRYRLDPWGDHLFFIHIAIRFAMVLSIKWPEN